MSTTRTITFTLTASALNLRKQLRTIPPPQTEKTELSVTEMRAELKLLKPVQAGPSATEQTEQLAVQNYKVALLKTIKDEMKNTLVIAAAENLQGPSDSKAQPIESKNISSAAEDQSIEKSFFSKENISRWTRLLCVLLLLITFNGIGLATGGLSLFFSAFGITSLSLCQIIIGSGLFLLPPIIGTLPFVARSIESSSFDDSEPLIQLYAQQRELTKSINYSLINPHLLKYHQLSSEEYEHLTHIANTLNSDMQALQNMLVAPQTTRLGYAALAFLGTLAMGLSVEMPFAFSAGLINHGLGVAATTIPSLLALNPVMFPVVFTVLFIGATTFIYTLFWLEINNQLSPARKHYDALKKNLDHDAKTKEWDKAGQFWAFFSAKKELEELEKNLKEPKSTLPRNFSTPLLRAL